MVSDVQKHAFSKSFMALSTSGFFLLTTESLGSNVLFQKCDAVLMTLIKGHNRKLLVTTLNDEFPMHELLVD